MKNLTFLFISVLIAVGLPLAAQQSEAAAQINKPKLADIRVAHNISAENQPMRFIFLDVLRGTGIHGGLVEMAGCSGASKGRLVVSQGVSVPQAMNALVAANPGYRWEQRAGVINLITRDDIPLLRTRIASFQTNATNQGIRAVLQDVLGLPEVRERETALGLTQESGQGGPSVIKKHPVPQQHVSVPINVQNASLRDVFNQIVQTSQNGVWIYRETNCNGAKTFTVEMATSY